MRKEYLNEKQFVALLEIETALDALNAIELQLGQWRMYDGVIVRQVLNNAVSEYVKCVQEVV